MAVRERRRAALAIGALPLAALLGACRAQEAADGRGSVVFRHPKLFGDPEPFDALLAGFERASGIRVRRDALPASSDEQHLFYAINLQARSREFDVLALDTIWVAEFAQAGWLRDLTHLLPTGDRADFFPGPLASVTWHGRIYGLPWFADAGLLYYRADLLARHGLVPPRTWEELVAAAHTVTRAQPALHGFVWQGKQYEGLVCNALEFIWSHGGALDAAHADAASRGLEFMRALVTGKVTPEYVTTLTEDPTRVIFGRGGALFLRNWPYAWQLLEREGSAVRGRVGAAVLPHSPGQAPAATLGGWQLGVNAFSPRAEAAERVAAFLAAAPAQKAFALAYGYSPPRRSLYADTELAAGQPLFARLRAILEAARPRPISPHYVALSQTLQAEFSAVLVGARPAGTALDAVRRAAASLEAR
ncbi:MAG TPA: ABC transporter substrate-binding protein [Burkholderiales bacterium]|nr:ABC transporter substrate-binding protein [Burkholderiales bacterium]